jgi:hypothetical protein
MIVATSPLAHAEALFARDWGGQVVPLRSGAFSDRSIVVQLPLMVAQAYPHLANADLDELTVSLCLFSDAIILADDAMDCHAHGRPQSADSTPELLVYLTEAYICFARRFGSSSSFWNGLRALYIAYLDAMSVERRVRHDVNAWQSLTEAACLDLAVKKNNLVRLVDLAVTHLGDSPGDCRMDGALHDYFVGNQMVDDLRDWREDVGHGSPSLLLRIACTSHPRNYSLDEIGRRIYAGRGAARVARVAEHHFANARERADRCGATRFVDACERRLRRVRSFQDELAGAGFGVREDA